MPTTSAFASSAPPSDPNASAQIAQQSQEAAKAEQDVLAQAGSGPVGPAPQAPCPIAAPAAPAANISVGLTEDQVRASWGEPTRTADVGTRKIYMYDKTKVIFKDGKVSSVE
jgi:hypothetical protein